VIYYVWIDEHFVQLIEENVLLHPKIGEENKIFLKILNKFKENLQLILAPLHSLILQLFP